MLRNQPINQVVREGVYELSADWTYEWFNDAEGLWMRVNIPQGYQCDGASVPRCAWTFSGITPDGAIRAAALVHDYIYDHRGIMPPGSLQFQNAAREWVDVKMAVTRKQADILFRQMLRHAGFSAYRRRLAFTAVRLFGGSFWNS